MQCQRTSHPFQAYDVIAAAAADIICLQEVQATELLNLENRFGVEYMVSGLSANHPTSAKVDNGVVVCEGLSGGQDLPSDVFSAAHAAGPPLKAQPSRALAPQ